MTQLYCNADLNYVRGMEAAAVSVDIIDGRASPPGGGWQTHGFELMRHASALRDFDDEARVADVHYAEISDFAQRLTGCDHALVSGHIARNPEQAAVHADLGPIQFVHSDFAPSYGQRIRDFYAEGGEQAEAGLKATGISARDVADARRMLILQFWRNVGPSVMDLPIAFCDARTVGEKETLAAPVEDYAGDGFDFETLAILPPGDGHHAWYTYPDMSIDEVVAFRTYDSELIGSGKPFWTPHSAYRNPDVALGQPARYSIELRATCLWK